MSENPAKEWVDDVSLWQAVAGAWRQFWSCLFVGLRVYSPWDPKRGYRAEKHYFTCPLWVWALSAIPASVAMAVVQSYGGWFAVTRGWPMWPLNVADQIACRVDRWVDLHVVSFTWLPADSGDPNEIGIHVRSDTLKWERDADGLRQIANRPRAFAYTYPALSAGWSTTTGGDGGYVLDVQVRKDGAA